MEYSLIFKPGAAERIKEQCLRSGQPIPDRILNAPLLPKYLKFFYDAFWELSTCRQLGMSEGPIPLTAIIEYGRFHDCDYTLTCDLIHFVNLMDATYLKHQNAKRESIK